MSDECPLCGSTLNTKQTVRKDALAAENAKLRTELGNAYKVIADYQANIQPVDCGELLD